MSKKLPIVAIIGQTNAGKSALFNRIVGKQDAIVAREAGTTRDNVVRNVDNKFILVDTAGLKTPEDDFEASIQDQISDAVDSADLILLVKDRTEYVTDEDRRIAKTALKSKKPVFLVLNKSDLKEKLPLEEFLRLGVKNVYETSAEHNVGVKDLITGIVKTLRQETGDKRQEEATKNVANHNSYVLHHDSTMLRIALIGRPNVGKSNLFNALAGKQQAIVAPIAGTTRDINRININYHNQPIELLDTAGVRRKGKIEHGIEKFSVLRTVAAIEEADICLLLMDVNELSTGVDLSLAGMITEAGKGIIIVVSKWDTTEDEKLADEILAQMRHKFDFLPYAPVIFTSSVTGKNVTKIFELATDIEKRRNQQIPTRKLNDVLQKAVTSHPPAGLKNTLPKMRYIVQTDVNPPWFVIYGANFKHIHWSYKRYLERQFRENFDLIGTPICFSFRDEKQIKANKEKTANA